MADYPLHVEIDEVGLKKLTDTFKGAYKEIVEEIDGASAFGVANRRAILSQIDSILVDLGVNINEFIKNELPKYYKTGADQAVSQLEDVGAPVNVKTGFNTVHRAAIANLVSDTSKSFGDSIQGVGRSANILLSKQLKAEITQRIAASQIKGSAVKDAANAIKQTLEDRGLSAIVDKSGRTWQLDTYAEMLYRTKTVETRNTGLANRMLENGYDLVQVSAHGAVDACGAWEGKVLSLTGATPGYDTVDQATADGLFHPNCRHAINAIATDLATELQAYNKDTGQYEAGGGLNLNTP